LDATLAWIAWLFGTRSVPGYVADLLDVRDPERANSGLSTIRPLGNAGRGPPLAPGTWMRLLRKAGNPYTLPRGSTTGRHSVAVSAGGGSYADVLGGAV